MNTTNTTVYNLEVSVNGVTFAPSIAIHDSGLWQISNHEAFMSAIGCDNYREWLMDFWANVGRSFDREI